MGENDKDLVLHASRRKAVVLLLGSALFVAVGYWMIQDGEGPWGWATALFFGACGLTAVASLLRPGSLRLTPDGFSVRHMGRGSFASSWHECDGFRTWSPTPGASFVMFDWTPPSSRSGTGALPDTYGMSGKDLARLLQTWRDRAVSSGSEDAASAGG